MRTILISAAALLVALPAEAKPKKKKTPSLTAAVAKAHARIDGLKESAETVPELIETLGVFKGKLLVTAKRQDIAESGGVQIIHATMRAKRGNPNRYRTSEERIAIADHTAKLKDIRDSLRIALSDENAAFRNDPDKKKPNVARAHKEKIRDIKRDHDSQLKEAQRRLQEDGKRIGQEAKRRKAECETVHLEIQVKGAIPDEWMKKPKMKLYGTVESFELGTEPEELGAAPRIAKLRIECLRFAKP